MNQKSFIDLLNRYNNGLCTEAEKLWVDKWYHNLNNKNFQDISSAELAEMQDGIWQKINPAKTVRPVSKIRKLWPKIAIAASIMVAFLIGGLYMANTNHAENSFINANENLNLITKTNDGTEPIYFFLSDSSRVKLKPNATIIYPEAFATNKRTVYLKGDAFFEVSKNRKKPFYVYNQNIVVKVLGTSFHVKSAKNGLPAQVGVRTGKVQVNENEESTLFNSNKKIAKPILLKPNQKGVFANHNLNKTLVDKPIPLAEAYNITTNLNYNFKEESLKSIFKTLTEAYGIDIISDNEDILAYTFTGDLSKKGLYEQLDLVCGSISSKYQIKGTSIVVSNKN
ncbi:FecR family protein [Pedobacter aquatilis]|uniref:FecR family protein n=1 Tax=Pedobacter aquatilis TaxID=351343 RepID=UPI0025B307A7|nr:FecR family protein [Pedobacter aquatilis]MDN3586848.1 FecR family protein [Pedobacter aquatilis]